MAAKSYDAASPLRKRNEETNRIACESIETALLQLLRTQEIQDISIEQIVSRAGVSRMAYYRNYSSKEAILDRIFERVCEELATAMHPYLLHDDWPGAREALFETLYRHKALCATAIHAHQTERLLEFFNRLSLSYAEDASPRETYRKLFWAGATFNVFYAWLRDGMTLTPEEVAEYCNAAIS